MNNELPPATPRGFKMAAFLRILLLGLAAFFVASRVPLLGSFICWGIVVFAAFYYPKQIETKIARMSNPTGYAVGMGVLMGLALNFVGMLVEFIFNSIIALAGIGAGSAGSGISMLSGLSAAGNLIQLVGAPFWGAVLGALGGLIGGSNISRPAISVSSTAVTTE